MKFKDDILKKINSDFREKSDEAIKAINDAIKKADYLNSDRIIRCIIFLSEGNLDELHKNIGVATLDPRDIMLWAEYEPLNGGERFTRVRDFDQNFDERLERQCEILKKNRLKIRKKLEEHKLEQYYPGDDKWAHFTSLSADTPDTMFTSRLVAILNGDIFLAKTIEGVVGDSSMEWIERKIPALDNLTPLNCIDNPMLYNRLKTVLMRMY